MTALNCKCHSELEAKLTARFKDAQPAARDHSVSLKGYGFGITEAAMVERGFMEYKATATFPLKKGGEKSKTTSGNMIFSYCPFCGKKGKV